MRTLSRSWPAAAKLVGADKAGAQKNEAEIDEEGNRRDLERAQESYSFSTFPYRPAAGDEFARVQRMRILSMHLKEFGAGQTNLLNLLAIDLDKILHTVGGRPYNVATMTKANEPLAVTTAAGRRRQERGGLACEYLRVFSK